MKRREFIILTGVGATGATVLSACGHPENKLIPALIPDNEYVPGLDYWKASVCSMCSAGCGIVVRTREHKANKIEGNPLHPVNRGALCARGQAGLQALYHPDRIRGPMKRAGERGSGQFEAISWGEAMKTLADRLRDIKAQGRDGSVMFAGGEEAESNVTGLAAEFLQSAFGARLVLVAERSAEASACNKNGYADTYRRAVNPIFDIGNASYLLSFGARFLETWHSPVMYSLAYGEFRRATGKARGRFVQVEPRMSLTAASADEWLPAAAGSEGFVALAIAQVIIREGLIKNAPAPGFMGKPIEDFAPEKTADQTGIPAEKIIRIARDFAASERPLAISGGAAVFTESGRANSAAINFLNVLTGNLNKPGGVLLPAIDSFDPLAKLREGVRSSIETSWLGSMGAAVNRGSTNGPAPEESKYSALLIHRANPAYSAPSLLDVIKATPFIASFSPFMDESALLADLILPDHTYLESWDIKSALLGGNRVAVAITQPVVKPLFDTKQTADVLIALGRELNKDAGGRLSFQTAEGAVKQAAAGLPQGNGHDNAGAEDDSFKTLVERGVWVGEVTGNAKEYAPDEKQTASMTMGPMPGNPDYPLTLLTYEHATLGYGEQANLPWLQELPDAMTGVIWGSWVEINPKTAEREGIADGDLVEVTTPHGAAHVPAVLYPAIRPDAIAMPYGQGHTAYGRYANGRGANAASLNHFSNTSAARIETIPAKISKVPGEANLIRFGTELLEKIENDRSR